MTASDLPAQSRRGKVCHVVWTTEGASWSYEQLRELRNRFGYKPSAIVNGTEGRLVDKFRKDGIEVFNVPMSPIVWELFGSVMRLSRLMWQERFSVVHAHLFPAMIPSRIAAWIADVPVRIYMLPAPLHIEAPAMRWMDFETAWMTTAIVPSCRYAMDLYRQGGVPAEKLHLVYYGPDARQHDLETVAPFNLRAQYGWSADTPVVAMVSYFYGRMSKLSVIPEQFRGKALKGHEELIRAAPAILSEFPDAKILLVGKGWTEEGKVLLEEMKALVMELGLENSVFFPGEISNVTGFYREIDVSVQAPLTDNPAGSVSTLLMECPIVATRIGAMLDTVVEGETGVLVEPENPADLARGIIAQLRDPVRARAMAVEGRKRMLASFTLDTTAERLDAIYSAQSTRRGHRWPVRIYRTALFFAVAPLLPSYIMIRMYGSRFLAYRTLSRVVYRWNVIRARLRGLVMRRGG